MITKLLVLIVAEISWQSISGERTLDVYTKTYP
jgi:hypothetical protein